MSELSKQFLEMIKARYQQIEEVKTEHKERGEIIANITAAFAKGKLSAQDYHDFIARVCDDE